MKKHHNHMYDMCKDHMHAYVLAETVDGSQIDGIITGLDEEQVYFAVPKKNQSNYERQYGGWQGGYGSNQWHGGYHGGGHYDQPGSPFTRLVLPLTALAAISLLPWY